MENKSYILIKKSIDATLKFENLMDSIDFDSYLEENKEDGNIKDSNGYKLYEKKTKQAFKYCDEIIKKIDNEDNEIKKASFKPSYEQKSIRWLLRILLKAKKTRLEARKQSERKKETKLYITATHSLHRAFDKIARKYFDSQKGKHLIEDLNWAKILYFNELAICYSGLAKSSMSFGYAEQSISLMEELYPKLKNIENRKPNERKELKEEIDETKKPLTFSQIIKLYTFALYNKGEAERLLHNDDQALRTFRRINDIYEKWRTIKNHSDHYSALHRKAMILIDMGRGEEAIKALDKIHEKQVENLSLQTKDVPNDYRVVDAKLEKASARIDRKEYEKAYGIFKKFLEKQWGDTFAQRKANVFILRLLNEFKKNRPEDFEKSDKLTKINMSKEIKNFSGILYNKETKKLTITLELNEDQIGKIIDNNKEAKKEIEKLWEKLHPSKEDNPEVRDIKKEYQKFAGCADSILDDLLKQTIARQDGGNFKKICTYLAEYFKQDYEKNSITENIKKSLKYFYLFLFNEYYFDSNDKSPRRLAKSFRKEVIPLFKKGELDGLLKYAKKEEIKFRNLFDRVDGEKYLTGFFDVYVNACLKDKLVFKKKEKAKEDKYELSEEEKNSIKYIVEKLKERLTDIYSQKENVIKLERIEERYKRFEERYKRLEEGPIEKTERNKDEPEKFIKGFFFPNKDRMQAESIVDQMKRNTQEFVKRVVGKSKIHDERKGEIKGILSILRRWNSFTPTLSSSVNQSKGGGYFLHFSYENESLGIVIDPGYDFLENFFSQGFKIGDIDVVLVSHAHPDHTDNFPPILSLFYEMNGRLGKYYYEGEEKNKKTLTLVLSPGVFEHYNRIIKLSEEVLKDIVVVGVKGDESETPYKHNLNTNYEIEIQSFGTSHKDLSEFQSLGFKIIVNQNKKPKTVIGYTGDARWNPGHNNWAKHFNGCSIICAHLGSIVDVLNGKDFCNTFCHKFKENDHNSKCKKLSTCKESQFKSADVTKEKLEEQTQQHNHLYLAGLASFYDFLLEENKKNGNLKVAIISEFGEELRNGIRIDLYNKFNAWFKDSNGKDKDKNKKKPECLPGDIGLEIDVFTGQVRCHSCKRFVERDRIKPVPYGKEEAICFVCKECQSVLSTYQIGGKLKEFCENGRKLELANESR